MQTFVKYVSVILTWRYITVSDDVCVFKVNQEIVYGTGMTDKFPMKAAN